MVDGFTSALSDAFQRQRISSTGSSSQDAKPSRCQEVVLISWYLLTRLQLAGACGGALMLDPCRSLQSPPAAICHHRGDTLLLL